MIYNNHNLPFFPLANSRTHEVCGPGAYVFAFAAAGLLGGQIMWMREGWEADEINPDGFSDFLEPSQLILCDTKGQQETLSIAEEALRSGAISLVVMTIRKPLGLTEGRRLQLAAREGKSCGLAIIPDGMGSNAAETRWHCAPVFDPEDSTLQKWNLIKNKTGTIGAWHVRWDAATRRLIMVSPVSE